MTRSTVVLPSIQSAYDWVDACAENLCISKGLASLILSSLCGYATWYEMAADVGNEPPTPTDESLSDQDRTERLTRFVEILTGQFGFDATAAVLFVSNMSPTSGDECTGECFPFSVFFHFAWDEDLEEEDDEDFILPEVFNDFADAMRLSSASLPHVWYNTLATLNWPVVDETFIERPGIGVPAFMVDDPKHGMIPVYVSSIVRSPADDTDGAAIATMAATKEAIVRSQGPRGYGLLFWKSPQTNNIAGEDYCYVGMLYSGAADQWDDMFLKFSCTSAAELIALHEATSPDFEPSLADKNQQLFWAITFALYEIESNHSSIEAIELRSPTGWMTAIMQRH
jgi:hypothetical protein